MNKERLAALGDSLRMVGEMVMRNHAAMLALRGAAAMQAIYAGTI